MLLIHVCPSTLAVSSCLCVCVGACMCVFTCVCVRAGQSESSQAAVSSRQHSEFRRPSGVIHTSCQCWWRACPSGVLCHCVLLPLRQQTDQDRHTVNLTTWENSPHVTAHEHLSALLLQLVKWLTNLYRHGNKYIGDWFTNMDLPTSCMQDLPILHTAFCAHLHLHAQGPLLVELIKNIFLTVL